MTGGTGTDWETGRSLSGWPHVAQSLRILFTTPKMSRVMRRAVGADLVRMVDAPISPVTIIDIYAAVAESIRNHEPRFKISRMKVLEASADGKLTVGIEGVYFPRGHLGDYSVSEPKTVSVPL